MDYRKFGETYLVRMDKGEEILESLRELSEKEHIRLASVEALGAVNDFTVGVLRTAAKQYEAHNFTGDHEIVSLTGTVSTMNGEYYCHLHMSAGDDQGRVAGGHLNRARISATGELVITILPGSVDRAFNEKVGLNLFRFDA